jgi:hypothetical protein
VYYNDLKKGLKDSADQIKEKNKIINILEKEENMLKSIIKPPDIFEKIDIIGCSESNYITGFVVETDELNKFVFGNRFKSLTIVCSDINEYTIINDNIEHNRQKKFYLKFFLNNDLSYWNGSDISFMRNNNLLCESNKSLVGIIFTKKSYEIKPICKNRTKNTKQIYFSPVYTNDLYGEKNTFNCENDNIVSDVSFVVSNKTNYLRHVEPTCQKNDLQTGFNGVTVYVGNYIDKVKFFKHKLELPCNSCSRGGKKHKFLCPHNTKILRHHEWIYNDELIGIQFICG